MRLCRWLAAAAGALALAGCTTDQAKQTMTSQWVGQPFDSFIMKYGPPRSTQDLPDGRVLYTWQSKANVYHMPATAHTTVYGGGRFSTPSARTTYYPASTVVRKCAVQIIAQPNGLISEIMPTEDPWGEWSSSMCSEIFAAGGPPPPIAAPEAAVEQ